MSNDNGAGESAFYEAITPQLSELRAIADARAGTGPMSLNDGASVVRVEWEQWNNHWTQWTKVL
jgi:hypothetical protein